MKTACLVLAFALALSLPTTPSRADEKTDAFHTSWVKSCLDDFHAIKPGMTRREIEAKLVGDGGEVPVNQGRYCHRQCLYFKIDVTYVLNKPAPESAGDAKDDKAVSVSTPYIQEPYSD